MCRLRVSLMLVALFVQACGQPTTSVAETQSPEDAIATIVAATMRANSASNPKPGPTDVSVTPEAPLPPPGNLEIVYVREGNIWLWRAGTEPLQLTSDGLDSGVRISDDGQVVAFLRNNELWAINSDGSDPRPLVSRSFISTLPGGDQGFGKLNRYVFVPNTHLLFLDFFFETDSFPIYVDDLWRVDTDDPAPAKLLDDGQGGDLYFSPDAQWVAVSQPEAVAVMRLDGSGYRQATTFPLVSTYSEFFFRPRVVWMNNSTGFYLILPNPTALETPNSPDRFLFVPLTGSPALLAEFKATIGISSDADMAPDGSKVGYVALNGEMFELHMIDASTADRVIVSSRERIALVNWSPDSRRFVYWQGSETYLGGLDGSAQLLNVPQNIYMRWVDVYRFVFVNGNELRLGTAIGPDELIDSPVENGDFDFAN